MSQPKLEIEGGDTYNWGNVNAETNEQVKAKVKIYNKGKRDTLVIYEVKPGCGCTTAPLDKNKIEPGGFATLDITLNVGSYNGDVHKTITIKTNDPENMTKIYNLKANVKRVISLFPKYMSFTNLAVGKEGIGKVVMLNATDKDIKILDINVEPAGLKLNINKGDIIPANGSITIEGKYTHNTLGRFTGSIKIKTDHEQATRVAIQVYGNTAEKENPR
jgi:hypothetical protein